MIQRIKTKTAVATQRMQVWYSARPFCAMFLGAPGRARWVSSLFPAVILCQSAFLLGYSVLGPKPATVQGHVESPVNLPAPVSTAPGSQRIGDAVFLGRPMTYYQRYTCYKFGPACQLALAIQSAENPKGNCEAYNYNSNGTLDWGYFQINSVHINRHGANLRDLLDCKANIDFAYHLYREEGFQPWTTFVNGQYRTFLDDSLPNDMPDPGPRHNPERSAPIQPSNVTAAGYLLDCAHCTPLPH